MISACTDCPHGSTGGEGATDPAECLCDGGFFLNNGSCEQCAAGTYKLDNGDGPSDYSDLKHIIVVGKEGTGGPPTNPHVAFFAGVTSPTNPHMAFSPPRTMCRIVAARGDTEFGEFVSLGQMRDDGTLTLARRYIASNDPRIKLAAVQVASAAQADSSVPVEPWDLLPWRV